MAKKRPHGGVSKHHLTLGAGGILAAVALISAVALGMSQAQDGGYVAPPPYVAPTQPYVAPTYTAPASTSDQTFQQPYVAPTQPASTADQTFQQPGTCPTGMTGTPPNCVGTAPMPTGDTHGCVAPQYWDFARNACSTGTAPMPTGDSHGCIPPGYWNGTTCAAGTAPTGDTHGCVAPQYWDFARNACSTGTMQTGTQPQSCSQGQYWNGSACAQMTQEMQSMQQGSQFPGPMPFGQGQFPSFPAFNQGQGPVDYSKGECAAGDFFCGHEGFDPSQYFQQDGQMPSTEDWQQYDVKNVGREAAQFSRQVSQIDRDIQQLNSMVERFNRRSGGFACPPIVEAQSYVSQLQQIKDAYANAKDEESIKEAKYWQDQEQEIRHALYGGPDGEMGVMGKAGMCEGITGFIEQISRSLEMITRQLEGAEKHGAPDAIVAAMQTAVEKLTALQANPLEGVSLDELFAPPDPSCFGGGFGGGGGFPGPMPMGPMNGGFGGMGGGGFGGFEGGFGGGFQSFGQNSVLHSGNVAQFNGGFGGGRGGMPQFDDECAPPMDRLLFRGKLEPIMRGIEEASQHFDDFNVSGAVCEQLTGMYAQVSEFDFDDLPRQMREKAEEGKAKLEKGIAYCEDDNIEGAQRVLESLFRMQHEFEGFDEFGEEGDEGFFQVDEDELLSRTDIDEDTLAAIEAKLFEKFRARFGADFDALSAKVALLESQLKEAYEAVAQLEVALSDAALRITESLSSLPEATKDIVASYQAETADVFSGIETVITQLEEDAPKEVVSAVNDLNDQLEVTVNAVFSNPLTEDLNSDVVEEIQAARNELASAVALDADEQLEVIETVTESLEAIETSVASWVESDEVKDALVEEHVWAFTDTPLNTWFGDEAHQLKADGVWQNDEARPGQTANGGEVACMIARAYELDLPDVTSVAGVNIPAGMSWAAPCVAAVVNELDGVSPATVFERPLNLPFERGDVAEAVYYVGNLEAPDNWEDNLPDDVSASDPEAEAIATVRSYEIMLGNDDGTWESHDYAPRVEIGVIGLRAEEVVAE